MSGNLCEHCTAACCRYVALPIETPETKSEFDDVRWYLIHEAVTVFVEDGEWYISFHTPCRHIMPDSRCGIYETRPGICRRYTTDNCDYHSGDYGWEEHFTCAEHLDAYLRAHPEVVTDAGNSKGQGKAGSKRGSKGQTKQGKRKLRPTGPPSRRRRDPDGPQRDRYGVPLPTLPPQP